jgi:hypothetical protein
MVILRLLKGGGMENLKVFIERQRGEEFIVGVRNVLT